MVWQDVNTRQGRAEKAAKVMTSAKPAARVKRISSTADLQKAFAIRVRVFVKEQGVPQEIELDRDDHCATHFLAISSGKAVGTARLVMRCGNAKIGRMAVVKSYRRKGFGTKLLQRAIATATKLGARKIYLHAQVPVIGFYEALGFHGLGAVFEEAGIPHQKMILRTMHNNKAKSR
jgi:predicted GNAT family N-acyltransferase